MKYVDVLIGIYGSKFDNTYTYYLSEYNIDEKLIGRRVLVEFGNKMVEAYIVRENEHLDKGLGNIKPVIKILDKEPVFDQQLLKLAEWIAEKYICPLPLALNLIVPRSITRKREEVVIPNISANEVLLPELNVLVDKYISFFEHLWDKREISLKQAKKLIGNDDLELLKKEGLIIITGDYSGYRSGKKGYVYKISDFNVKDLPVLIKRAPRQAEVLKMLFDEEEIDCDELDKNFSKDSINTLLRKGYIQKVRKKSSLYSGPVILTEEQGKALKKIKNRLGQGYAQFLLYGVTGSGKSEVYIRAAEACIKMGKSVIILVPEIALTRHLVETFEARIPDIAVMHSGMTLSERYEEYVRVKRGEAKLVLGTRSAVFAPVHDLGLIIVDEEQENTYKQEETPRYHAVEVARKRAQMEGALLILGSATPSIETFYQTMQGKMELLELSRRVGDAVMPQVYVEDMRIRSKNQKIFSPIISNFLYNKIADNLAKGEQSILFLNRRGYSLLTICAECGSVVLCPHCSVAMTYHQDIGQNICHYCNFTASPPRFCTSCNSKYLKQVGFGTQRVEEELKRLFPAARVKRLDIDISRRREDQKHILENMKAKKIDILIGTQMIAKGFNFPEVSLVGILDADGMLNLPDFRAAERAFQLIVQAAGRAGRGKIPGEVIIQTYQPDNPVIDLAARQDYVSFYYEEIKLRKILKYPPFTNILRLVVSALDEMVCKDEIIRLADYIIEITDAKEDEIEILGPAPCPIMRIRDKFRYQLIVKCENILLLRSIGKYVMDNKIKFNRQVRIEMDINPMMSM